MKSRLLDKGQEVATFFPALQTINRRGETAFTHSVDGIERRVTVSGEEQSIAELAGNVSHLSVKLLCREVPGASDQMRVKFRGETYDLAAPPHYSSGASKSVRHMACTLRSRNKVGEADGDVAGMVWA